MKSMNNQFDKFMSTGYTEGNPIMLIGDQFGDESKIGDTSVKAFTSGMAAKFLRAAMALNTDRQYYVTNSLKVNDYELNKNLLLEEIELIKPSKIITLGRNAKNLFYKITKRYPDAVTDHPSYIKRFNKLTVQEYSQTLR